MGRSKRVHYLWEVTDDRRLRGTRSFRTGRAGASTGVWRAAFSPDGKLLTIGEPRDVVELLRDRYDLDLRIDEAAFRKIGKDRIGEVKPKAAVREEGSLDAFLQTMLDPFDAGYEIRKSTVWIVPLVWPQNLAERLQPAQPWMPRMLAKLVAVGPGIQQGTPLAKALQDVSRRIDRPIYIDQKAFERAGIKEVEKRPVGLSEQKEIRVSALLHQLLKPAGATFVARDSLVLVVPLEK
jgi:hypothetical protein